MSSSRSTSEKKDYYKILGVEKDADDDTIKKAYRKLAMKWHPDRNPGNVEEATEKFKEIGEAYEVLSDPRKKRAYDSGGSDRLFHDFGDIFGGSGHSNPFDLFNDLFQHDPFFSGFGDIMGGSRSGGGRRDPFGGLFGFSSMFDDDGMGGLDSRFSTSTTTFSSSAGFGGFGGASMMSSTQTFIDGSGRKITRKTVKKDGVTTVEEYENGKLINKSIDGVKQDLKKLEYKKSGSSYKLKSSGRGSDSKIKTKRYGGDSDDDDAQVRDFLRN